MTNRVWIVESLWSTEHNIEAQRTLGWTLAVTPVGNLVATPVGAFDVMKRQAREGEPLAKRGLAALAAYQLTKELKKRR